MERLICIFFISFFSLFSTAKASDTTLQLKKTITGEFKNFEVDNLGNIYLVSTANQIKKVSESLDSIGVFNDSRRFGNIISIDVNNPLKILVFYKDFSTILTLDRFLNIRNNIDLRTQNLLQVSCIATSYDNNIWLFDEVENKLKKIDDAGNVLLETVDFRLLFDNDFLPQYIIDTDGKLYLYNKQKGLVVFDYYGALKNKYAIVGLDNVQIINNEFNGFTKDGLQQYNLGLLKSLTKKGVFATDFPAKKILRQQQLYTLSKKGLDIYNVK